MFFPCGSVSRLNLPGAIGDTVICINGNRDRLFYVVLTADTFFIYLSNPHLLLYRCKRAEHEINEQGENRQVYWRQDSTAICITTSKKCLLIYRVEISPLRQCYNVNEPADVQLRRSTQELFIKENRPKIIVSLSVVARLSSPATCVVALREELLVALRDGWIHRLMWTGRVEDEYSFQISRIPFSIDQLQSKADYLTIDGIHVIDAVYAPLIGGFSLVLSDGRAALLTSPNPKFHPNQLLAVWAMNINDATCTTTNHKYRLINYGCSCGDIVGYHLDDVNGSLIQAYRVSLSVKDSPELLAHVGSVSRLQWFAQGAALAVVWRPKNRDQLPIAAVFSPFGAQLWCSLESATEKETNLRETYYCVEWGPEGYHLWFGSDCGLSILPFARFIGVNNPVMDHIDHIVLLDQNHIYMSPSRKHEQAASTPQSAWNVVQVPHDYLSSNWPIRFCAVDISSTVLAIAGSRGLAHCNVASNKWRLFGNESQERDMVVTGGIALWNHFIVAPCYDIEKERDALRFYSMSHRLDEQFCTRIPLDSRVLLMNMRCEYLITFDMDMRIFIYRLSTKKSSNSTIVDVERCAEIRTDDMVPHPACVVTVQLTALNHNDSNMVSFCPGVDTVLVNVSGRLIMLIPSKATDDNTNGERPHFQLNPPLLIASYVEHVWHDMGSPAIDPSNQPHLTQALWINCGARGMKVWMPLFPGRNLDSSSLFISKRIMLPFELSIHPIVISSRDCLALGVESVPHRIAAVSRDSIIIDDNDCISTNGDNDHQSVESADDAVFHLHRNSEVFLHHLLRQMLKRNLGLYALEIAGTCRYLPYFAHVLELLLHHVLEEEATSSEPIPDPLLPRIVAFIQEFPEFLQTVVHCARKTELALWPALFVVTNHPRELFEVCIRDGQLETAASYLIVLQNMESSVASREHAEILLKAALDKKKWTIANDIVRFLKAIDAESPAPSTRAPICAKLSHGVGRLSIGSPKDETDAFVFGSYGTGIDLSSSTVGTSIKKSPLPSPPVAPLTTISRRKSISKDQNSISSSNHNHLESNDISLIHNHHQKLSSTNIANGYLPDNNHSRLSTQLDRSFCQPLLPQQTSSTIHGSIANTTNSIVYSYDYQHTTNADDVVSAISPGGSETGRCCIM